MPSTLETRFGPSEIVAPLAACRMGGTFPATDTRLGHDVAAHALPPGIGGTPGIRA